MAAVAPPADQTKELLQKLSLEPKNKTNDAPEATKKNSGAQQTTANGAETMNNSIVPLDRSLTPILKEYADGNMCYLPNGYPSSTYYYGGYDVMLSEWEDYARYVNPEGVEMFPGFYEDMYRHPYGYASYGPYPSPGSPVPTMGHDGQLHGPQHYQFSAPYYQTSNPTSTPFINQTPSSKGGILTSLTADQPPVSVDSTKSNANTATKTNSDGNNVSTKPKQSQHSLSSISNGTFDRGALPGGLPSSGYQDPRFGFEGMWTTVPWFDGHMFPDVPQRPASLNSVSSTVGRVNNSTTRRNQNLRPLSRIMGSHAPIPTSGMGMTSTGIMNNIHGNNQMYGQNTNAFSGSFSFGSNALNVQWGIALDNKYKPRDHRGNAFYGFGNENLDGLSELNRGPRAGRFKNQKGVGQTVTLAVKGQPLPAVSSVHKSFVIADRDQYNKPDFPEAYLDAKFFVIKSYSEDDIHKSIKYNVWASTPNGNKKLDAAYHEASEKTVRCPVFLFFSVNTSGQFVGVAEMIGPVDFNKTVEYWQQDKWTGCFPVKWHIVKDVPNNVLKHITLENNDNKPVTNSRDTQEVNLEQGHQVLKLLKEHVNRTSILDDFSFYEVRQKVMQEKRTKQQYLQKKVVDGRLVDEGKDKHGASLKSRLQVPLEDKAIIDSKDPAQCVFGEKVLSEESGLDAVAEKRVLANGITS